MKMIRRVWLLFLNELEKQVRSKLVWLGAASVGLASFLWPQGLVIAGAAGDFTGFVFMKVVAATVFESVIPLFVAMQAAGLVASETQDGTDRTALAGPVRRGEWLLAKFATTALFALALTLVHAASAVWAARGYFDFVGYEEFGEEIVSVQATALAYAAAYGWLLAPMAAAGSFGFFVSTVSRSGGAAMGVAAGTFAMLTLFRSKLVFFGFSLEPWLFISHIGAPLQMAEELSAAISTAWWTPALARCVATSLATVAGLLGASLWLYSRRDLTG